MELPTSWKNLQAVAACCALALMIAQNTALAQVTGITSPFSATGPFAVERSDATWRDGVRERDVPVRIYAPRVIDRNAAANTRFPVSLFSHGLGGSREGGKLWSEHWATHGYVVIAMQHAGSDESLWNGSSHRDRTRAMKSAMTLNNAGLRIGDVRFVIDEVIRRALAGEAAFARADAKRIGMSGHSFGSQTTMAMSGQKAGNLGGQSGLELRITSAIAFSPNARNKRNLARQYGDIRIPVFSITGTADGSILGDGTRYQDRLLPFENMALGGKYLVVFDAGDHMVCGGHEFGPQRAETARDREIQGAVKAGSLAFWDATLKDDAVARQWLTDGGFQSMLDEKDRFASK